jgi:prepilin-type N-terminal cleavage/methylation domain-containing protein
MRKSMRGFNLLELMFVLAVGAVLLGIGVPSFSEFIRNMRMTSAANDLLAGIYAARAEAIKRHAFVGLCLSPDPRAATPACSGAGDAINGWFVWVDDDEVVDGATIAASDIATDGDGDLDTVPGEEVLLRGDIRNSITTTPDTTLILYGLDGFTRASKGGILSARQITLCDERGNVETVGGNDISAARGLAITVTGRPSVTRSVAAVTALGGCP